MFVLRGGKVRQVKLQFSFALFCFGFSFVLGCFCLSVLGNGKLSQFSDFVVYLLIR